MMRWLYISSAPNGKRLPFPPVALDSCFRFFAGEQPRQCRLGRFVGARPALECRNARQLAMTPESAPTVQQLLAFYLEAGVDCALVDVPVNRVADGDTMPKPGDATR